MPTFVHTVAKHGDLTLDYGFLLRLSGVQDLLAYWAEKRGAEFGEGLSNFLASKECEYLTRGTYSGKEHVSDPVAAVLSHICQIEAKKERDDEILIKDVVDKLLTTTFGGMLRLVRKAGAIYVNANGGYFPHSEDVVIYSTIEQDGFDFPITDFAVKVFQWQGGRHYYAKVGHLDVVDTATGNQKWNTHDEAQRQAEAFAKTLKASGTKRKRW